MWLHAGRLRRAVLGCGSTLAIVVGMVGAVGPAATATPTAGRPTAVQSASSSLSCVYEVTALWPGGFVVEITLTNTGTSPVAWSLIWTWQQGQQITSVWNANFSQTGETVAITGTFGDSIIPPGGSVTFGFAATGTPPPVLPFPCTPAG